MRTCFADAAARRTLAILLLSAATTSVVLGSDADALLAFAKANPHFNGTQGPWPWKGDPCEPKRTWYGVECSSGRVISLKLSGQKLGGTLPVELGDLLALQFLNLSKCGLTGPIPGRVGKLSALQQMDLSSNQLTGPIPVQLGDLMNLEKLLLSGNRLTGSIPREVQNLHLKGQLTNLEVEGNNLSAAQRGINIGLTLGAMLGALALLVALGVGLSCFVMRKNPYQFKRPKSVTIKDTHVKKWMLSELRAATRNFNDSCIVGKGGSAMVYRAELEGKIVAVKRLVDLNMKAQGRDEFVQEVQIVGMIQNRNLVTLQGYCIEGDEWLLVYDYVANGTLEDHLFGSANGRRPLTWQNCVSILIGTACGISHLHEGCQEKIIHRDIKPANILLDVDLTPRVADFGLCRRALNSDTHVSTKVAGTLGYLAPEYAQTGQLTEKSDVYSFGILMLVVISHRPAFNPGREDESPVIVDWAYKIAESNRVMELVGVPLPHEADAEMARRFISVAFLCIQPTWHERPSMASVVLMLKGTLDIPCVDFLQMPPRYVRLPGFSQFSSAWEKIFKSKRSDSGLRTRSFKKQDSKPLVDLMV